MTTADELGEMLDQACHMPHAAARTAVYDQVLPHVDTVGDPELAFTARMAAADGYVYVGEAGSGCSRTWSAT